MKKKIILAVAIITACLLQNIQANNYVWIHGLTDDESCWTVYQQAFTASNGIRVGYSSEQAISEAARKTWENTNGKLLNFNAHDGDSNYQLSNKNDMILIGHSMGGLVSRELQYQYGGQKGSNNLPKIKGIITLGTPHEGAQVENSVVGGRLKGLVTGLVTRVVLPTQLSLNLMPLPGISWVSGALTALQVTSYLGFNSFVKSLGLGQKQCEKDMQTGSSYMNTIGARKVTVPILCFAAEEERWPLARLAACSSNSSMRTDPNANADGKYDQKGYNILQNVQQVCNYACGIHTGIAVGLAVSGFCIPYNLYLAGLHGVTAAAWYSTSSYINNGLDFDHAGLVGATRVDAITENHRFLWRRWTTTKYITVPEPHDGVVPIKSQYLATNKGTNVIIPAVTIKGVNHVEEFNHPNTRDVIRGTLDGSRYANLGFKN